MAGSLRIRVAWSCLGRRPTPPTGTAASVNVQAPATVPGRQTLIFTAYAPCQSSLREKSLPRRGARPSDETARRSADDAVMAGIVASDTADDRAFQTTLG